ISSDAEAGAGAVSFDGGSYLTASSNLLATLAGDFTVSLWLNTSQSYGNPGDLAWEGAGVLCADSPNPSARDLIPVALTGGQVAFNVGDGSGNDDTLNSSATVNDGNWHHIVVTRSQATGQRQIYIDGALDSSDAATTGLLNSPVLLTIGAISDASNPDPTSPDENGFDGYQGLLDDVQIYDRVLSSTEVTFLYNNPGQTVAGTGGADFNTTLGTTNLNWTTIGDASWFTETTNTYNGSPSAAQSGSVTGDQSSTLSLTVTGPGTLTFYWSSIANDPNQGFDCDFYINGNLYDYISGDSAWGMDSFNIPSGTSTLTWTAAANGDTDPTEAAFLDQVSYVTAPSLTASANPQAGPAPLTVQFSTPDQDTGGFTVTNWNWSFGDGATSTAQNPTHTYLNPGTYSPSLFAYSTYSSSPLTIVNGFGTITATVTVTEPTNSFFNTLYSFTATTGSPATNSDGANPEARLILSGNTLYGTAYYGGSSGFGTVFAVNTSGADFTSLYSFTNGRDGAYPWAELLLSGQTLYGTASAYLVGGSGHWGTVFAINTNGTGFTNLYNFTGGNDGGYPHSGFVLSGSTLFGTAAGAGSAPDGTVFAINTNGTGFTNLYNFTGGNDGEYPNSSVILAGDTLYGSTYLGGDYGSGTVFAVNTNGQSFTNLVQFKAGDPQGSLILSGQTLYGATLHGGSSNSGAVFRVNTDGTGFTNIYSFTGGNDGSVPNCNLVLSGNALYGTASSGGVAGNGTVFMVETNGMGFTLLHIFTSLVSGTNSDGANPQAGLILSGNTFYGTTAHGGPNGNGTMFSFTLSATALPVTLVNPQNNGANFQFQFLSQSGFTHTILYRTNLAVGNWLTNSTVTGNGTVTNISLPYSLFSPAKQGFIRVSTQ
ncbi:MAG: choice-of-anchor tandem repeat GloVer-containing protein, partial [Limisphaerales bacterium]